MGYPGKLVSRKDYVSPKKKTRKKHKSKSTHPNNAYLSETLGDGAWAGQRCFLLGGGPSLKGFDFSLLDNELTIGVNRIYEVYSPNILICLDWNFYDWLHDGEISDDSLSLYNKFEGIKAWVEIKKEYTRFGQEVQLIRPTGRVGVSTSLDNNFFTGGNSGFCALSLALCLGANPIYLLGYDMITKKKPQRWWHNGYPRIGKDRRYAGFRRSFVSIALGLKDRDISVINLNPKSGLKCFPFAHSEQVLWGMGK